MKHLELSLYKKGQIKLNTLSNEHWPNNSMCQVKCILVPTSLKVNDPTISKVIVI